MAQNRTFVPEMPDSNSSMDNFYRNMNNNQRSFHGTVIENDSPKYGVQSQPQESKVDSRNILGFLYSISNGGKTEFWPLYQGKNVIGSSKNCDICLLEASVSELHATLVIQQQRNPEKVVASLRDEGSEIGTLQNGVNVGFTNVECFNGDIITIGNNYELLLLLIDKKDLKLNPSEHFEPLGDDYVNTPDQGVNANGIAGFAGFPEPDVEEEQGTVGFE